MNAPPFKDIIDHLDEGVLFLDKDRKVRYWSRGAETLTGFSETEVMGSVCSFNCLRITGLEAGTGCTRQCSVHRVLDKGEIIEEDIQFHHKDGHRIPMALRIAPWRNGPDGPIEGAIEIFRDSSHRAQLQEQVRELQKLALLDPLTGIGNRRFGSQRLETQMEEMRRYETPFGLLFMDLDKFKGVNDTFGHDAGDRVLRAVAKTLRLNLRSFDHLARWGGEEFLALVLNVNSDQLSAIAEKLRELVEQSPIRYGSSRLDVTVSIGATLAHAGDNTLGLLNRVDHALYAAKAGGRNRVVLE